MALKEEEGSFLVPANLGNLIDFLKNSGYNVKKYWGEPGYGGWKQELRAEKEDAPKNGQEKNMAQTRKKDIVLEKLEFRFFARNT